MWKPLHSGIGCSSPGLLYHICSLTLHYGINDNTNAAVNRMHVCMYVCMYVCTAERPHTTRCSYILHKNNISKSKHAHNNYIQGLSTVFNELNM